MAVFRKLKQWLKQNRRSSNRMIRWGIRVFDGFVSFVRTAKGILTEKNSRAIWYMRLFQPKRTHQTTADTCMNRYPGIFSACRDYFGTDAQIRILSYGCATGEEVVTLRQYFPNAEIVGAEINKNSLRICRSRNVDGKIRFIDSTPEEIRKNGPYDAVFCMAVFQRTPGKIMERNITDLSRIYPFSRFENQILDLDDCLKEKGLLILHLSQYDLCDTAVYHKYSPCGDWNQNFYGPYVFGQDSKIKKEIGHRNSIFIKNPAYTENKSTD